MRFACRGKEVPREDLLHRLLFFANRKRDMDHPDWPSMVTLVIRCDRDIAWREVRRILELCRHDDVRIYLVRFAVRAV